MWTIIDLQREFKMFQTLSSEVIAGKFDSVEVNNELKCATLSQVLVGSDKDKLMVTSASQSFFNICEEVGKHVKFVIEIGEQAAPFQNLNTTKMPLPSWLQLRGKFSRVPLTTSVNTNKDRLYNDLVHLMKELGVKWIGPNVFDIYYGILMDIMRRLLNVYQK